MANNASLDLIFKILVSGEKNILTIAQNINAVADSAKSLSKQVDFTTPFKSAKDSAAVFTAAFSKNLDLIVDKVQKINRTKVDFDLTKSIPALSKGLDLIVDKVQKINRTKVDFDVTKSIPGLSKELDLVVDKVYKINRTKVDFDLTKSTPELLKAAANTAKFSNELERLRDIAITSLAATEQKIASVQARLVQLGGSKLALTINATNVDAVAAKLSGLSATADKTAVAIKSAGASATVGTTGFNNLGKSSAGLGDSLGKAASEALFIRRIILGLGFAALGKEVVDTAVSFDKLRAQFKAVFQEGADKELAFIKEQADRLGVSVTNLGDQYAKFLTAVKGTAIEGDKAKQVFLATAEAAQTLSLSTEDFNGALTALQQIASKGRLSLEELRQQLGDRLPGAVRIAAEAIGVTQQKLFALIEAGQIDSNTFLSGFGDALRKNFGTDGNTRIATLASELQRVKNAFVQLLDTVVQGDGTNAIKSISNALVKFATDPATIAGLQKLVSAIATFSTALVENAGVVLKLVEAYVAFKVAALALNVFDSLAGGLARFTAQTAASAAATTALTGGISAARSVFGAFTSVLAVGAISFTVTSAIVEALGNRAEAAAKKASDLAKAIAESARLGSGTAAIKGFAKVLEELDLSLVKNSIEIRKLTETGLKEYIAGINSLKDASDNQIAITDKSIASISAEIAVLQLKDELTEKEKTTLAQLTADNRELIDQRKRLVAQNLRLNASITESNDRLKLFTTTAEELDRINFDGLNQATKLITKSFDELIAKGTTVRDALDKAIPEGFSKNVQKDIENTIQAFQVLANEGKASAKNIQEAFGSELKKLNGDQLATFQTKAEFAFSSAKIGAEGLANALRGSLIAALENLGTTTELAGSNISKSFADIVSNFSAVANNAQATALQLKGALDVAREAASSKAEIAALSEKVKELGVNGKAIGPELADSLVRLADKARLVAGELNSALGDSFIRLGVQSIKQLNAIADQASIDFKRIKDSGQANLLELQAAFIKFAEEAARANNGIPPISLRIEARNLDLFDILVKTAETAAERIRVSFESAVSTANTLPKLEQLRIAIENTWNSGRLSAEEYGKAVATLVIKGFEVAVDAANTAANRISQAFSSAINSADIKPQVQALSEALGTAFDKGLIGASEFKKGLDEVQTKLFEIATEAPAGFAGALGRLGVQSRSQLQAIAEQYKQDFASLRDAGVLTIGELKVAFDKYAEAAVKAGITVTESLGGVSSLIREQGGYFQQVLADARAYFDTLQSAASKTVDEWRRVTESTAINLGNLADKTQDEFLQLINSAKQLELAGRGAGLVEGLIRAREEALALKGILAENADEIAKNDARVRRENLSAVDRLRFDRAEERRTLDAKKPKTVDDSIPRDNQSKGSIASVQNNNFNFNQPNVTPEGMRQSVIPALDRQLQRQGSPSLFTRG
jgi:tape measure domain-containing protein